jgi:acyl carrier protein
MRWICLLALASAAMISPTLPARAQTARAVPAPVPQCSPSSNVFKRVRLIISEELGVQAERIHPQSTFDKDLGADQLDITELAMACEEQFNIDVGWFPEDKIKRVQDLVELIESKLCPPQSQ